MGLQLLAARRLGVAEGIATGLAAGAASLALTVGVDSVFWGRLLWPEAEVLMFNTVRRAFPRPQALSP